MDNIDTLPLLRLLGDVSHQMLSRGEVTKQGISDTEIAKAEAAGLIIIAGVDNTRNGERSSFASLMLTDAGEALLDEQDC
jgi:hypothetical protein